MTESVYGNGEAALALSHEPQPIMIGRYLLHRQIARGGMATIHIARLMGDEGFSRIVAAKRLLPEFAEDSEFVAMFLDEARIASKVHHRNVVPVLDVVTTGEEAILVQEYVHGAPLHFLLRTARQTNSRIPLDIAVSIACQVLAGLHAAHETRDELGAPLHIVHRDVSPQNVMVAVDGTARLLDFGVAKATMAAHVTREGQFKGKLAYSAPEQLRGHATRQSDLYSLAVVLWELIVGHRMHHNAQAEVELVATIMNGRLPTITDALVADREALGPDRWRELQALEPIIKTGLAVEASERWATAADMEHALIDVVRPATSGEVAAWLKGLGRELIDKHGRVLAAEEASWRRVGTSIQRRLASGTVEPRRGVQASFASAPTASQSQPRPMAPGRSPSATVLIAVLCTLVVVLAVGVVLALRGGPSRTAGTAGDSTATLPAPAPSNAAPPIQVAPAPPAAALAAPAPAPIAAPVAKAAAAEPAAADDGAADPQPSPGATSPSSPPRNPPARLREPPPRRPSSAAAPSPARKPAPAAAAQSPASAAEPATDCNPPYYFDGQKKIFKPSCI
jgi:serine/threonine-protein kinase